MRVIPNDEIVQVLLFKYFAIRLDHFEARIFHAWPRDQRTASLFLVLVVLLTSRACVIYGRLTAQLQHNFKQTHTLYSTAGELVGCQSIILSIIISHVVGFISALILSLCSLTTDL